MTERQSETEGESLLFLFDEAYLNKGHPEHEATTKYTDTPPQSPTDDSEVKLSETSTKPIDIPQKKKEFVPEYPSGRPHTKFHHGDK